MCGAIIAKSITLIIMKEFCLTIRKHLKLLVILKLTKDKIKEITYSFESLHRIPYILSAIDGSHISIVAPKVDPKKVLLHIDSKNCRYKMQILGLEL
jgi:hypothetical protein